MYYMMNEVWSVKGRQCSSLSHWLGPWTVACNVRRHFSAWTPYQYTACAVYTFTAVWYAKSFLEVLWWPCAMQNLFSRNQLGSWQWPQSTTEVTGFPLVLQSPDFWRLKMRLSKVLKSDVGPEKVLIFDEKVL